VIRAGQDVARTVSSQSATETHFPSPLNVHSNLSKMQSFSYKSHSFCRRWSCMLIVLTGLFSMLMSQILSVR
jgi:hypothetical protein